MRIRLLAVGTTAAALLALSGCSSSGTTTSAPTSAPAAPPAASSPAPASSTPAPASSVPAAGSIPSPNTAQITALIAALKAVDPGLAADQAKAVSRARSTCQEIKAGKDDATLANNAASRFSGGSVTLTPEQGAVIVAGVKASFCG